MITRMRKIIKSILGEKVQYRTSCSDDGTYPEFCALASKDDNIFSTFRTNRIYNGVLEHVSEEEGATYLKEIENNNIDFLKKINIYRKNDLWGTPRVYQYEKLGSNIAVSPTTLRYVKVLSDCYKLFDLEKVKKITEIGIGYGGQARVFFANGLNVEYNWLFTRLCG